MGSLEDKYCIVGVGETEYSRSTRAMAVEAIRNAMADAIVTWYTDTIAKFAVEHTGRPKPIVYTLPDAPHYFFLNNQAFVVLVTWEFLLGNVNP